MASGQIAPLTSSLRNGLEKLVKDVAKSHPARSAWAEDQLAKIRIWADSLGVFAQREDLSVVRLLAKRRDIASIITALLTALSRNTASCNSLGPEFEAGHDSDESSSSSDSESENASQASSKTSVSAGEPVNLIDKHAQLILEDLSRLGRLSMQLRHESAKRKADEDKATYVPPEEVVKDFQDYLDGLLRRDLGDPNVAPLQIPVSPTKPGAGREKENSEPAFVAEDYLRQRTREAMLSRWRRISWQCRRAQELAGPQPKAVADADRAKANAKAEKDVPKAVLAAVRRPENKDVQVQAPVIVKPEPVPAIARSLVSSIKSSFRLNKAEIEADPKPAKTVTTRVGPGKLDYPPYPTVKEGFDIFNCTICGLPQRAAEVTSEKWPKHVLEDLKPYMCLEEACTSANTVYKTMREWTAHMEEKHARDSWSCKTCTKSQQELVKFDSSESYKQHLRDQHSDDVQSESEVTYLVRNNRQGLLPLYDQCQFCGFVPLEHHKKDVSSPECQRKIIDHMCQRHMQSLALSSLPFPPDDEAEDGRLSVQLSTSLDESATARQELVIAEPFVNPHLTELEEQKLRENPDLRKLLTSDGKPKTKPWTKKEIADLAAQLRTREECIEHYFAKLETSFEPLEVDSDSRPLLVERDRRPSMMPPSASEGRAVVSDDPEQAPAKQTEPVFEIVSPQDDDAVSDTDETESAKSESESAVKPEEGKEEIYEKFRATCREGKHEELSAMIAEFGYLTLDDGVETGNGYSVWHDAIEADAVECLKLLIEHNLTGIHWTWKIGAMTYALLRQRYRMVRELMSSTFAHGTFGGGLGSPLHIACCLGNEQLLETLLSNEKYDVRESAYVQFADYKEKAEQLQTARSIDAEDASIKAMCRVSELPDTAIYVTATPIHLAAYLGNISIVKRLKDAGAAIDDEGSWLSKVTSWWPSQIRDTSYDRTVDMGLVAAACRLDQVETVQYLLSIDTPLKTKTPDSRDPMVASFYPDGIECLRVILERTKTDEDRRVQIGEAMNWGAAHARIRSIKYLLEQGISVDCLDEKGYPAIVTAATYGHRATVDLLLEHNPDLNLRDDDQGYSALIAASAWGHPEIIRLLLERGVDINLQTKKRLTATMGACLGQASVECLKILLEHQPDLDIHDDQDDTALHLATLQGQKEHIKVLLNHGFDIESEGGFGQTPLIQAACFGDPEVMKILLDRGASINAQALESQMSPLIAAAYNGELEAVKVLLEAKANMELKDKEGRTALFEACRCGHNACADELIKAGASTDIQTNDGITIFQATVDAEYISCVELLLAAGLLPEDKDKVGNAALLLAIRHDSTTSVSTLLEKGCADVDAPGESFDRTPLMVAADRGYLKCIEILLAANADIDCVDEDGNTALHLAAFYAGHEIIKMLLMHDADVKSTNNLGQTPLMRLASGYANEESIDLLLKAGSSLTERDKSGKSALDLAISDSGNLGLFIDRIEDIDATDETGCTLLMRVVINGADYKTGIVLDKGASINKINPVTGMTALAYTLTSKSCYVSGDLLGKGAKVEVDMLDAFSLQGLEPGIAELMTCGNGVHHKEYLTSLQDAIEARIAALRLAKDPAATLSRAKIKFMREWAQRGRDGAAERRAAASRAAFEAKAAEKRERRRLKVTSVSFAVEPESADGTERPVLGRTKSGDLDGVEEIGEDNLKISEGHLLGHDSDRT